MKHPLVLSQPTPVQVLDDPIIRRYGVRLLVKRDDLTDPVISGNKWRKLKYNLEAAHDLGKRSLLSFGGAYSNHIHALAGAACRFGFRAIGVIRGEVRWPLNPTLQSASDAGMTLHYLCRERYRRKNSPEIIADLQRHFGDFYLLPEGGSNALALPGCGEIVDELRQQGVAFDHVCCACGSGGTLAGLITALHGGESALGIAVLKDAGFLRQTVRQLLAEAHAEAGGAWDIAVDYHFGGYAKVDETLARFVDDFVERNGIPIEPVYTGKLFFGLYDLIRKGYFRSGETVVVLHSGGLQGLAGMRPRLQRLLQNTRHEN